MPLAVVRAYDRELSGLVAIRQRLALEAAMFPHLDKSGQRNVLRELDKATTQAKTTPQKLSRFEYLRALTEMGVVIVHESA